MSSSPAVSITSSKQSQGKTEELFSPRSPPESPTPSTTMLPSQSHPVKPLQVQRGPAPPTSSVPRYRNPGNHSSKTEVQSWDQLRPFRKGDRPGSKDVSSKSTEAALGSKTREENHISNNKNEPFDLCREFQRQELEKATRLHVQGSFAPPPDSPPPGKVDSETPTSTSGGKRSFSALSPDRPTSLDVSKTQGSELPPSNDLPTLSDLVEKVLKEPLFIDSKNPLKEYLTIDGDKVQVKEGGEEQLKEMLELITLGKMMEQHLKELGINLKQCTREVLMITFKFE